MKETTAVYTPRRFKLGFMAKTINDNKLEIIGKYEPRLRKLETEIKKLNSSLKKKNEKIKELKEQYKECNNEREKLLGESRSDLFVHLNDFPIVRYYYSSIMPLFNDFFNERINKLIQKRRARRAS